MRPYKLHMVHNLRADDGAKCVEFSDAILRDMEDNNFLSRLIFSNEAAFYISGKVNRHKSKYGDLKIHKIFLNITVISRRLTCFVLFF